jgi:hypothetical protein
MRNGRGLVVESAFALVAFALLVTRVPTVERFLANADHGYHLAAGAELLRGRLPGVDVFINYGPLAALLGAATLYVTGGDLVAEALLCAAAWAVTVWMVFRLMRRNFGATAGWCAGISAFISIPRFHKWWVWLVPLAALVAIGAPSAVPSRRRWLAAGVVCGLAALMRPDLGLATLAALVTIGLVDVLVGRGVSSPGAWMPLALGFALPPVLWGLTLLTLAGPDGLGRAIAVVPEMVSGTVASFRKPPPPLRLDDPFSPGTAHAFALRLLPATEFVAIVVGLWLYRDRSRGLDRTGRLLMACGVMGLASYHHTVYRADIHHLWQGIWPLALTVPALAAVAARLVRLDVDAPRWPGRLLMTLAVVLVVLSAIGLWPILAQRHIDLAPYGRAPLAGLAALRQGVAAAPAHPYAQLVGTIARMTTASDEVLMLAYGPQLLVFARRGASGPTVAYQRGLFDSASWRRERLIQFRRRPPALVVVPNSLRQLDPDEDLRVSLPEIYELVRRDYPQIVDRQGRYTLLAPAPSVRPPTS